jgi:hypothetical protein
VALPVGGARPQRSAMKLQFSIKLDPETGEAINQEQAIHDAIASWIASALTELKDPNSGLPVTYSVTTFEPSLIPQVGIYPPELQKQAELLIAAKYQSESPFQ